MAYLELRIVCTEEFKDILIAELEFIGYDSFVDHDTGFSAFIPEAEYPKENMDQLLDKYDSEISEHSLKNIPRVNWNQTWEQNYDPIIVENRVVIRATFHHLRDTYEHEILIDPKMSFGTGHHESTYLMLKNQLDFDHSGKKVLDAGCGTGVLAIFASKCGAESVNAFDIDNWAVENSIENARVNSCDNIQVDQETIKEHKGSGYDLILANINKNVLLDEADYYSNALIPGGSLFLSGFYENDIPDVLNRFREAGFRGLGQSIRNHWASIVMVKE